MKARMIAGLLLGLAFLVSPVASAATVGGGGPMPSVFFLTLDDLNEVLVDSGYPSLPGLMFLWQAGGHAGDVDGVRIGGYGGTGDLNATQEGRSVALEMIYGGLSLEKGVRADDEMVLVLGTLLGGGTLDLTLVRYLPSSFQGAVETPYVSSMSKGFFAVQPYVAFETQPLSWLWSRLQIGFLWTLTGDWEFESAGFPGPPSSLGGLSVQMMFRFGPAEPDIEPPVENPAEEDPGNQGAAPSDES